MIGLLRREKAGRGSRDASVRLTGELLVHPSLGEAAIFEVDLPEMDRVDGATAARILAAFRQLCTTLDHPLQVLVQSRRLTQAPPSERSGSSIWSPLEEAMRRHWWWRLESVPAFQRRLLLIPRCEDRAALDHAGRTIERTVLAAQLRCRRITPQALITSGLWDYTESVRHLQDDDGLHASVQVTRWPGQAVIAGWLEPLWRLRATADICIHLEPVALGAALSRLNRRLRSLHADRLLEAERGVVPDALRAAGTDAATALRARLATNRSRPLRVNIVATMAGATQPELQSAVADAEAAIRSTGARCRRTWLCEVQARRSTLPLGIDALGGHRLVDSDAATGMLPLRCPATVEARGYRIGIDSEEQTPLHLDPFNILRHRNANVAVFAASGHGKSYTVGALLLEAAVQGRGAIVIDPENEYRRIIERLGGAYVDIGNSDGPALNVFELGDIDECAGTCAGLVDTLCGGQLGAIQRAAVDAAARSAVRRAVDEGRIAILADIISPLSDAGLEPVSSRLRGLCDSSAGRLLNRPGLPAPDAPFVAFGLREAADELLPAITLLLAQLVWQRIRDDPRPRHIVFDEVGLLAAHPPLRRLLVQLARRCRKYQASLVVATQNAQDLLRSEDGAVVATNCAIVALGGHRPAETALMERTFGLTPEQREILESAGRGRFLLLSGDRRAPLSVEVPPLHHAILTGASVGADL